MKTKILLLLCTVFTITTNAQTKVVSGINIGISLDYDGNHLYIAQFFGNEISRMDLTVGASSLETVTSVSRPEGVAVNGNDVHIAANEYNLADISGTLPTSNTTLVVNSSLRTLVYDAAFGLYLIVNNGGSDTKIYSVSGTTTTFITNVGAGDIRGGYIDGTEMYLASRAGGAIYKFDLNNVATPTLVKSGLNQPYEIDIADNHLYYASEGGILGKFDLADTTSSTVFVNNTLGDLAGIEVIGDDIYFTSWDNNAVYKVNDPDLSPTIVNIPDANFKAILIANNAINTNGDTEISSVEARNYSGTLDVANSTIADLTGIEAFTNISALIANDNVIETVDLSENRDLIAVNLQNNNLTNIDLRNGYNHNISGIDFTTTNNPNLTCIEVDDENYSTTYWTGVDVMVNFAKNCCIVNIPDVNFKAVLLANIYINRDGDTEITCDEAAAYNAQLNVDGESIADLTGIEAFTSITSLNCEYNSITSLDISANTALTKLYCHNNQLISLDVSVNTALTVLNCFNNSIASLDISTNTALTRLDCYTNSMTNLNISGATALTILFCNDNSISSLDLSANTALYYLNAKNNALTSLNVTNGNNANFTGFFAQGNSVLTCIQVDNVSYSDTNWTDIDTIASFSENCGDGLSVDEFTLNSISLFPNPVQDLLHINLKEDTIKELTILNTLGQVVLITTNLETINVSNLIKGIYFLKIRNNKRQVVIQKFIKK